ncbi:hypothetical protein MSZK_31830 [Mycobacterium sp. shizuoka-1]|nr:hypothetical protein MSZK_31830 [Mycobacterium sp. shizuoka-1]
MAIGDSGAGGVGVVVAVVVGAVTTTARGTAAAIGRAVVATAPRTAAGVDAAERAGASVRVIVVGLVELRCGAGESGRIAARWLDATAR